MNERGICPSSAAHAARFLETTIFGRGSLGGLLARDYTQFCFDLIDLVLSNSVRRLSVLAAANGSSARAMKASPPAAANGKPRADAGHGALHEALLHDVLALRAQANGKPVNGAINGKPATKRSKKNGHHQGSNGKISKVVLQDRQLVDRCLTQEPGAWSQMYARFHAPLLASVRAFLGQAGRDPHLVDEIAARVWYALIRDEFWLLARFDVRRGCRFSTFLSLVAKAQARLLLRSERRRRTREQLAAKSEVERPDSTGLASVSGEEFIATLSPAERTFLVDVLVSATDSGSNERYTRQNHWQLRHRVREKLKKFLE